jgi:hypothetical protein
LQDAEEKSAKEELAPEEEADLLQQLVQVSLMDAVWRMLFLCQTEHVAGKQDMPLPCCW